MQSVGEYQLLAESLPDDHKLTQVPTANSQELYAAIHDSLIVRLHDPSKLAEAGDEIISLIEQGKVEDIKIIEVLWVVFTTVKSIEGKTGISVISEIIKRVVEARKSDRHILLERLDDSELEAIGLVNAANFEKKRVRLLTKNRYEQQKFGLFREESEGFSKLCQELLEIKDHNKDKFDISLQNITSLIGFFDLDYNRVIDLVLEFSVYNPGTELYFDLLKTFKKEFTGQILGFKFQRLVNKSQPLKVDQGHRLSKKQGPGGGLYGLPINLKSLAKVAARLIGLQVTSLEDLWPHLKPEDQAVNETFAGNLQIAFDTLYRAHNPSLKSTVEQEDQATLEAERGLRGQCFYNQKLWLMQALVLENNFQEVMRCFNLLGGKIDLQSHLPLLQALCEFLEGYLEPAYRKVSPSILLRSRKIESIGLKKSTGGLPNNLLAEDNPFNAFETEQSSKRWDEWTNHIESILQILGTEISSSPNAYTKLLRVCRALMKSANKNRLNELVATAIQSVTDRISSWIKNYIIPSMILFEGNPQASQEAWLVIENLETYQRYALYEAALNKIETQTPKQIFELAHVVTQTKTFIRTLVSLKEDDKSNARIFAKVCHNAPLQVLTDILTKLQGEGYDNMIPSIVGAMSYSLPLSVDIALFLALKMLSRSDKSAVKEADGVLASWIQNLAIFVGLISKKHHKADLSGVLVFIANKLASDEDSDAPHVILLKEVLAKMGGYETISNLSEAQLAALGGGLALKTEACGLAEQVKAARKSGKSLANVLWNSTYTVYPQDGDSEEVFKLSMPFLLQVSLAKMRERVLLDSTYRAPAIIEKLHELLTQCLFQISLVLLFYSENPQHYAQLLPQNVFNVMTALKVQPEIAFKLLRPSLKQAFRLEAKEWNSLVTNMSNYQESLFYEIAGSASNLEYLWARVSKECFSLFWTLDVEKILVPTEAYNAQIKLLTEEKAAADPNSKSKQEKTTEKKGKGADSLEKELQNLVKENEKFEEFLETRKEFIVNGFFKSATDANVPFLQHCCLPRLKLSAVDALFAARFISVMLTKSGFNFLDQLVFRFNVAKHLFNAVGSCSELESDHLGIFLCELLTPIDQILKPDKYFVKLFPEAKKYDRAAHFGELTRVRSTILGLSKELCLIMVAALRDSTFMQTRRILRVFIRMSKVFPVSKDQMAFISVALHERIPNGWPSKAKNSLDLLAQSYRQTLTVKETTTPEIDAKEMESIGWLAKGKIVQFMLHADPVSDTTKPSAEDASKVVKSEVQASVTASGQPAASGQNGHAQSNKETAASQKKSSATHNNTSNPGTTAPQKQASGGKDPAGGESKRQGEESQVSGVPRKEKDSGKGARGSQPGSGQTRHNPGGHEYYGHNDSGSGARESRGYERTGYSDKAPARDNGQSKKYPGQGRTRRESSSESKVGGGKRRDERGERGDRIGRGDRVYVDKRNPNSSYTSGKDAEGGERGEKRLKGDRGYDRHGDPSGSGA